jgi:hypothetical protein
MGVDDHFAHSADVRVMEEHGDGCLPDCADLFREIFLSRFGLFFRRQRSIRVRLRASVGGESRDDLDSTLQTSAYARCMDEILTFSRVC